ncbi:isoprenoid synthase domain-containing protein [Suillus subluteus]|nr:isoprenoid synthase domain-containing protein [Suillus subluteus]
MAAHRHLVLGLPCLVLWQIGRFFWTKTGVYAWYSCQIAFSSVVALHKMVLLSPSCVASKVLEAQLQHHLQQLGILAHVFPPSRARSMSFAAFAAGAPVGDRIGALYFIWLPLIGVSALISFDANIPSLELVKRVDSMGASLVTVGFVLIVFYLIKEKSLRMAGNPLVRMSPNHTDHVLRPSTDIITLLIVGVIMLALFLVWEWKLERIIDEDLSKVASMWTPPPLVRLLLWTQAKGWMVVILIIALLNFIGWSSWVQIGTAFSPAISTIVFNTVVDKESAKLGVTINSRGTNAPISAQLMGYEDARGPPLRLPLSVPHLNVHKMNPTTPITMFPTVTHTTTPDGEPSQFILPDLINDCHYPLRKNPHRDAVSRASDQWLINVARLEEPEIRGYIDMDGGGFAAVCYPDADAFHLQVCSDFNNCIFIVDDWMEYGIVDIQGTRESCIFAFRDPVNFDSEQVAAKMCKSFFSRFRETAGPGCTERFIRGSELFFAAVAKQVDDRAKGNMYDLESYLALRRDISALKMCLPLIEFSGSNSIFPTKLCPIQLSWLWRTRSTIMFLGLTDILSYNKEQSRDLQGAMDYAGQMCKDAIQRFETNRAILPSVGGRG